MQKIYEVAVLFHPLQNKDQKDKGETAKSSFLKRPEYMLAKDDKEAQVLGSRMIPDEYLDRLDQVEIAIRPF